MTPLCPRVKKNRSSLRKKNTDDCEGRWFVRSVCAKANRHKGKRCFIFMIGVGEKERGREGVTKCEVLAGRVGNEKKSGIDGIIDES